MIDYLIEPKEIELPICDECGEDCCVGVGEAVILADTDLHFCDFDCFIKHMRYGYSTELVEAMGGNFV